MNLDEWQLYNHGWLPKCAPHETPDLSSFKASDLFRRGGVLIRYTTDFDQCETQAWWYVVKDEPFDIAKLNSRDRRYVKIGERNFEIKRIDPKTYAEEIYRVAVESFSAYPKKYRPHLDHDAFISQTSNWREALVYGAFLRGDNLLCAYSVLWDRDQYIEFDIHKADPKFEKMQVNAGLIYGFMTDLAEQIAKGKKVFAGSTNVLHETNFQDYLIRYFKFRKAYCKLHLILAPKIKWIVNAAYPFRKIIYKLDRISKVHQLNGVLRMMEVVHAQKKD